MFESASVFALSSRRLYVKWRPFKMWQRSTVIEELPLAQEWSQANISVASDALIVRHGTFVNHR